MNAPPPPRPPSWWRPYAVCDDPACPACLPYRAPEGVQVAELETAAEQEQERDR